MSAAIVGENGEVMACAYVPRSQRGTPAQQDDCIEWGPPASGQETPREERERLLPGGGDDGWGPDDKREARRGDDAAAERRGLIISFATLVLSVPALIGAWCWPALVIPLLGGSVTSASRFLGHWIAFFVNIVVFAFSIVFVHRQSSRRAHLRHWLKYGPTYLTIVSALLVMADNTRHVLQDTKVWPSGPWPGSSQYISECTTRAWKQPMKNCTVASDCGAVVCEDGKTFGAGDGTPCFECYQGDGMCSAGASESIACLSAVGWVFTVGMTYSGFLLFFFASFWNANLVGKLAAIRNKWNALRQDGQHTGVRKEITGDVDAADAA